VTKKKLLGDETFAVCDFSEMSNKLKIGDHIIVDFGNVCFKVIGFENESDFLASKSGIDVSYTEYDII
jgi:hypothetical protein